MIENYISNLEDRLCMGIPYDPWGCTEVLLKMHGICGQTAWVQLPAPSLAGCEVLNRFLYLSVPWLPHLKNGDDNRNPPDWAVAAILWVKEVKGLQMSDTQLMLWKSPLLLPSLWKRFKRKYNYRLFQSIKHLPAFQKTSYLQDPFLWLRLVSPCQFDSKG